MEYKAKPDRETTGLRCDLHTHSLYSDGTCTPGQLVAQAKELGLILALTDHNTVAGLPEFMEAARKLEVTAVPGVEFTTEHRGKELHLLGLFLEPEHYAAVERMTKEQHVLKEFSNMELVERLNQAGYGIRYADVKRRNPNGNANRAHVAAELVERGYLSSVKEAFATVLSDDGGFYVPVSHLSLTEVAEELRKMGALPVLAHPLQELTEQELRQMLPAMMEAGLRGMETSHSSYSPEDICRAEAIAAEFGLLPSGGSDFHGHVKPDIRLGVGKGHQNIPPEIYWDLRRAWEESRG